MSTRAPSVLVAPERTHFPPTPARALALRAEGRRWSNVAASLGCTRWYLACMLVATRQ